MAAAAFRAQLAPANELLCVGDTQRQKLETSFQEQRIPSQFEIELLAAEVGLTQAEVKRWFQHRLACWRQQQGLPANGGSVIE